MEQTIKQELYLVTFGRFDMYDTISEFNSEEEARKWARNMARIQIGKGVRIKVRVA